jgi:hypothetical protein
MQPTTTGKSIADRMRDCISAGMDAKTSAEKIAGQISMKRMSKKRLMELHGELSKAVCEFCARDFTPKPGDGEIGKRFCSVVCYESAFTHGETD